MSCKGNWVNSAKNVIYYDNVVECELQKIDSTYEKNKFIFNPTIEYQNINGRFQSVFDKSILFLIINMNKNKDRWNKIESSVQKLKTINKCNFIRIEGIDGKTMENNEAAKQILQPKPNLIGQTFQCYENNESWTYHGNVSESFPGLFKNGHFGTKGLCLSNVQCFQTILTKYPNYNWYCILEDDGELNQQIYQQMVHYININQLADVIALDNRGARCGTSAILYNQRIITHALEHLHPLSNFSINNESTYGKRINLWDWKLWSYLDVFNIKNVNYSLVPSGSFKSEIS